MKTKEKFDSIIQELQNKKNKARTVEEMEVVLNDINNFIIDYAGVLSYPLGPAQRISEIQNYLRTNNSSDSIKVLEAKLDLSEKVFSFLHWREHSGLRT